MAVQLWLTLVVDDKDFVTYVLNPGMSPMLGRDDSANDIVLHDPKVSRVHARIVCRGDSYYIQDLGSTAGTKVDGRTVTSETKLDGGELVSVGSYVMRADVRQWAHLDEDAGEPTVLVHRPCPNPACGASVSARKKFCPACGSPMSKDR